MPCIWESRMVIFKQPKTFLKTSKGTILTTFSYKTFLNIGKDEKVILVLTHKE